MKYQLVLTLETFEGSTLNGRPIDEFIPDEIDDLQIDADLELDEIGDFLFFFDSIRVSSIEAAQ